MSPIKSIALQTQITVNPMIFDTDVVAKRNGRTRAGNGSHSLLTDFTAQPKTYSILEYITTCLHAGAF